MEMLQVMRVILLVAHIVASGVWIAQFPVELAFARAMHGSQGKAVELPLLMAQSQVVSVMGQVGGLGILLTGFGLLWTNGWGLLNIGGLTPTWLLIKQIVYLIALGIVFVAIIPMQRRLRPAFIVAAQGKPSVTPEIRRLAAGLQTVSRLVNGLVLVNIVLAVWKPF